MIRLNDDRLIVPWALVAVLFLCGAYMLVFDSEEIYYGKILNIQVAGRFANRHIATTDTGRVFRVPPSSRIGDLYYHKQAVLRW